MEDLPLGRIAALVPEFAVKDLPLGRTHDDHDYPYKNKFSTTQKSFNTVSINLYNNLPISNRESSTSVFKRLLRFKLTANLFILLMNF